MTRHKWLVAASASVLFLGVASAGTFSSDGQSGHQGFVSVSGNSISVDESWVQLANLELTLDCIDEPTVTGEISAALKPDSAGAMFRLIVSSELGQDVMEPGAVVFPGGTTSSFTFSDVLSLGSESTSVEMAVEWRSRSKTKLAKVSKASLRALFHRVEGSCL